MGDTAKAVPARSNPHKPSGRASMPSGRLYLAVLVAAVAAFFVVPVAQAAAAEFTQNIEGNGKGEVSSVGGIGAYGGEFEEFGPLWQGEPPIECSYASPGPATGVCNNEVPTEEGAAGLALRAIPAPGSEFAGWVLKNVSNEPAGPGVDCSSEPQCFILVSEGLGREATAIFCTTGMAQGWGEECNHGDPFATHLTVYKTGEGTVVISPGGNVCTPAQNPCLFEIEKGATIFTLTASPATGWAFSSWAGCLEHVGRTCKVLTDKARALKVTFIKTPSFTIEKAGSGYGKVAAMGISCDESCSKASSAIKTGFSVTVKATPAKGSEAAVFEGGTGSASGCSGATCTFTISADSSVKVKFDAIPTKTLTVNLTGPGAYKGKVSGKGIVKGLMYSAIACGSGCTTQTETFFSTDTVTLTAVAAAGYTFAGWSGSEAGTCTGITSPCTISTSANKALSVEFK